MKYVYTFILFFSATYLASQAQVAINGSLNYTQNFDGLISSGSGTWTDNTTIANWYAQRTGSGNTIAANNGSANSGNLYSMGSIGSTDRSLGTIGSTNATAGDFAYGILLQNTGTTTVNSITISYTGEQWRNSGAAAQTVSFYYKKSSSIITNLNPNSNSTWIAFPALNFTSPITGGTAGALDGNLAANRQVFSNVIVPVNLVPNEYIMLKWDDPEHTGSDHMLGIDDVSITYSQILPISNLGLHAETKDKYVALNWQTSCEQNLHSYEVQRSFNNINYTSITSFSSRNSGCATTASYSYDDYANTAENKIYYRIKINYNNNDPSYSNVVAVTKFNNTFLTPYLVQNPVQNMLRANNIPIGSVLQIVDGSGKVAISNITSSNNVSIDISTLINGKYFLIIKKANSVHTLPFVKTSY